MATQVHTLPTHHPESQLTVSDQERAQPPGALGALLCQRYPPHLSIVQGPFGRHCPLPCPKLLFCCRTCQDGSREAGATGAWLLVEERVAPRWSVEPALEGGPGCGFYLSAVIGKIILKLLDLSLPHVLAGASPSRLAWTGATALVAALSPGPMPTVLPGLAHVAGGQPLWYQAGHPPLLPYHPEPLGRD